MPNWNWTTLDKLGTIEQGKWIGSKKDATLFEGGNIPYVQGGDINGNQLYISNTDRKYNPKGSNQGRIFPKNTVCFAKYCFSKGESSLLKFDSCLSFAIYGFNSYKKISDPKFIKYCFDYPVVKHNLLSLSNSSTCHQNLTLPKLLTSLFPNPPYEIQRKIGNTLSSYDELIEALEEKIELLEIIRDSLYKEWFIKLRFPNHEKFSLKNSLPKNWKVMNLKDISGITKGTKPASYALDLFVGGGHQKTYPFFTCSAETQKSFTYSYDSFSLLISEGGNFRVKIYKGKFEASDHTYILSPNSLKNIYVILGSLKNIHIPKLNRTIVATTIKNMSRNQIENLKILIPDRETLEKFNTICEDIQLQIENLEKKKEDSNNTRKTLLKKIFNRKIKIS